MDFITHALLARETACRGMLAAVCPDKMMIQKLLCKPKLLGAYDLAPNMAATAVS